MYKIRFTAATLTGYKSTTNFLQKQHARYYIKLRPARNIARWRKSFAKKPDAAYFFITKYFCAFNKFRLWSTIVLVSLMMVR